MPGAREVADLGRRITTEVERAVVGKRDLLGMVMAATLAGGRKIHEGLIESGIQVTLNGITDRVTRGSGS